MSRPGDEPFVLAENGRCDAQTEESILVRASIDGRRRSVWIPQSVVHDDSEVWRDCQRGKVVVKRWWAEKKSYC